ncbi:MAG TPA: hypothetical protein VLV87_04325 [Gammaproteobacteria bacterium]|nr:hypothetical protein [Gammaproteobacteria bacterium]
MRKAVLSLIGLVGLVGASVAHAECAEGPQRAPNAKETAYYSSHFKVLRAVLPKPPAGWQYSAADKEKLDPGYTDVPEYLCGETQDYYIGLDMGYERPTTKADAEKMQQAMQMQPDPAKQKELDGLLAQEQALIEKSTAAAQKQDYRAMDAIGKQSDALNAKISKLQAEMNAPQTDAMNALQRDRQAKVRIAINDAGDATCYGSPKPIAVPGAVAYQCEAPATFSSPGNQLDAARGRIVVVFGKGVQVAKDDWSRTDDKGQKHDDSGVILKYQRQAGTSPVVQFVTVDVEGDDLNRAMSLYKQMDLAPLAALVKK